MAAGLFATREGWDLAYGDDNDGVGKCCGLFYGCGFNLLFANLALIASILAWVGSTSIILFFSIEVTTSICLASHSSPKPHCVTHFQVYCILYIIGGCWHCPFVRRYFIFCAISCLTVDTWIHGFVFPRGGASTSLCLTDEERYIMDEPFRYACVYGKFFNTIASPRCCPDSQL